MYFAIKWTNTQASEALEGGEDFDDFEKCQEGNELGYEAKGPLAYSNMRKIISYYSLAAVVLVCGAQRKHLELKRNVLIFRALLSESSGMTFAAVAM
jgi:hypothetical protein